MVRAKVFLYAKPFDGMPTDDNFKIVEEELPPLKDGEFLTETLYISVDPYQRAYSFRFKPGQTMIGGQISKIIESKSSKFPVGGFVYATFGWRTHTISSEKVKTDVLTPQPKLLSYDGSLPLSLYLGVLGMPGATANIGFLDFCKPKAGETVVVTGAAGAVGSIVGQIAKIKGCKVIGIVGAEEKSRWIESLGFDHAINYKTEDVEEALKKAAPNGVDCFFDNVGGEICSIVIRQMNRFGRISACGAISSYNDKEPPKITSFQKEVVIRELEMKGFIVSTFDWSNAIVQNIQWVKEEKLKYNEMVVEGFENTPKALIALLNGENIGKAIVKV